MKPTNRPAAMDEDDRTALRAEGFSDHDIWDIVAVAAFYNMSNRLAAAVEMRPNPEYHAMARQGGIGRWESTVAWPSPCPIR